MPNYTSIFNLNHIDDNKLVQVRGLAFSVFAFAATLVALIIDLFLHMYVVSLLVGITSIAFLSCIWFCLTGRLNYFKLVVMLFINGLIFLLSYAQGRETFVFLYYIPFIFCIPFIMDSKKKYDAELFIYVILSCCAAFLSVLFSPQQGEWEVIDADKLPTIFLINVLITICITALCALSIIYSDRFFRDILNRKIDKAEMASIMKNRFLSGTSHELRTAINGVTSASYMLQSQQHSREQEEQFRILKYCSDHMINIVNEILDFDKIVAGKLELYPRVFNISKLLHEAPLPFIEAIREKKISFKTEIDKNLENRYVISDDFRIIQVINNLLANAVKFTDKGAIQLTARLLEEDENDIKLYVSVSDTGIGIAAENIDKIFSEYWQVYNEKTLTNRGTGLGLSISKNILKLFKSNLAVSSTPGEGSIFSFRIDLKKVSFAHIPSSKNTDSLSNLENVQVLIAEDDPVNMMVATKILESRKAIVHKATNGHEVLDQLQKANKIDFVLMDLEMPLMTGYEAICQIREKYPLLPVIAFTAAMMDKHFESQLLKSGFSACIAKPFKPESFFSKINEVMALQS